MQYSAHYAAFHAIVQLRKNQALSYNPELPKLVGREQNMP